MGDVIQVFDPSGALVQTIETGAHTEPTNCCIGDGVLYVTMSGSGELVACEVDLEPLPLHPYR
jgi:gluconolactonase